MIGIKDSSPHDNKEKINNKLQSLSVIYSEQIMMHEVISLSNSLKNYLGRPSAAHGVTPLMIYREINVR